jgi:hypothetical protein
MGLRPTFFQNLVLRYLQPFSVPLLPIVRTLSDLLRSMA